MTSVASGLRFGRLPAVAATCLMIALAGCGGNDANGPKPLVADGWVETSLPNRDHTPAFVTIRAVGNDRLIDANVPDEVAAHTLLFAAHGRGPVDWAPNLYGTDAAKGNRSRLFPRDTAVERFDPPGEITDGRLVPSPANGGPVASQIDEIPVKQGELVQMHRGGFYLMLAKLQDPIVAGEKIPVSLSFEKAGQVEVLVPARDFRSNAPGRLDPPAKIPERVAVTRKAIERGADSIRWTSNKADEDRGILTGVAEDDRGVSVRFGFLLIPDGAERSPGREKLIRSFQDRGPRYGGGGYSGVGRSYFDGPESGPTADRAFQIEFRVMDEACIALTGTTCSFI